MMWVYQSVRRAVQGGGCWLWVARDAWTGACCDPECQRRCPCARLGGTLTREAVRRAEGAALALTDGAAASIFFTLSERCERARVLRTLSRWTMAWSL